LICAKAREHQWKVRDLFELGINEGKRPVTAGPLVIRSAPTQAQIRAFESRFDVKLPDDYLSFLRFSNGGHPKCGSFESPSGDEPSFWTINLFYHLEDERDDLEGLWGATDEWQPFLPPKTIPIGDDGCGNQIALSCETGSVHLCLHEGMHLIPIASSFSDFLDLLHFHRDR
jgi:hypothetical protein